MLNHTNQNLPHSLQDCVKNGQMESGEIDRISGTIIKIMVLPPVLTMIITFMLMGSLGKRAEFSDYMLLLLGGLTIASLEFASLWLLGLILGAQVNIVKNTRIAADATLYMAQHTLSNSPDTPDDTASKNWYCHKCGTKNTSAATSCASCGTGRYKNVPHPGVPVPGQSPSVKCVCGERFYGEVCPQCGRQASTPATSQTNDAVDTGWRCPRCDTRNNANARVCKGCGASKP